MNTHEYYVIKAKVRVRGNEVKECYLSNSTYIGGVPSDACWASGMSYATKFNSLAEAKDFFEREKSGLMSIYGFIAENSSVVIVKVTLKEKEMESLLWGWLGRG